MIKPDPNSYLIIYHNGSRGDFLLSILLGNILINDYQQYTGFIIGPVEPKKWRKWHMIDKPQYGPGGQGPYDRHEIKPPDQFDFVIRIKLDGPTDFEDVTLLSRFKMKDRNWITSVKDAARFEDTFAPMDNQFDQVIPYRDLWDLEKIKILFQQHRGRPMTEFEEYRVQYNIKINQELLQSLKADQG